MQHGIHHVTAIAGRPGRNLDFYSRILGLRFVKKTVNFDDPGTYHLYYGDAAGAPGTIMTFFPWADAAPGRPGGGETAEVRLAVPQAAIGYWVERLAAAGTAAEQQARPFGDTAVALRDPDGMAVALIGVPGLEATPGWAGAVPAEHAVRGVHSVSLAVAETAPTADVLAILGLSGTERDGDVVRLRSDSDGVGTLVDLSATARGPGRQGAGTVHHVAFRADEAGQAEMAERLRAAGIATTPQIDRTYFRSVYFREPGGVLFEIATDDPGFAVDEPAETLGEALKLPPRYEPHRAQIEAALPAL